MTIYDLNVWVTVYTPEMARRKEQPAKGVIDKILGRQVNGDPHSNTRIFRVLVNGHHEYAYVSHLQKT